MLACDEAVGGMSRDCGDGVCGEGGLLNQSYTLRAVGRSAGSVCRQAAIALAMCSGHSSGTLPAGQHMYMSSRVSPPHAE